MNFIITITRDNKIYGLEEDNIYRLEENDCVFGGTNEVRRELFVGIRRIHFEFSNISVKMFRANL